MSFVQVMSHSGGGLAADRTPFYGIKLPPEVKNLIQLSKKVDHATMRKVLKGTVHHYSTASQRGHAQVTDTLRVVVAKKWLM